jgi:23S rRNA pseudouridine1911/1915/1917 synthase
MCPSNPTPTEVRIPARLSGKRLDLILAELFPDRSKAALQKLVRRGAVEVDGRRVLRSNIKPGPRARLTLRLDGPETISSGFELKLLHEDEAILVFDKPAGLLTHSKSRGEEKSLSDFAVDRFGRLPLLMGEERPGIVHRLDRETSGVIVLARTGEAMERLRSQFRAREVRKEYTALAHGAPLEESLELRWDIGPDEGRPDRQRRFPAGQARSAETLVELGERFGDCSLLCCRPLTGRRHQIRVHLHAAGLPIIADKVYGAKHAPPLAQGAPRTEFHCLHASRLEFRHPQTGETVIFESPLRDEMLTLLNWLRRS